MPGKTAWQQFKEIPAFVAAIIGIVAAIIGMGSWITNYFATKQQLEMVQCISNKNEDLLSKQVKQSSQYSRYIQIHVEIEGLKNANAEPKDIRLKEADANLAWDDLLAAQRAADEIVSFLKSGGCLSS